MAVITAIIFLIFFAFNNSFAGQYFCDEMDHFSFEGECKMKEQKKQEETKQKENEQVDLWCDPQMDPSTGQVTCKMPPKTVLDLLQNPTPENAKKYLEWNQKKMEQIVKAQQVVEQVTGDSKQEQISIKDIKEVDFYFSTTCPHCQKQAQVIKKIAKLIPNKVVGYIVNGDAVSLAKFLQITGLKIPVYHFSSAPYKNITAVPLTIIVFKDGKQKEFLGFTENFGIAEINQIRQ